MKKLVILFLLSILLPLAVMAQEGSIFNYYNELKIKVTNPAEVERTDEIIKVNLKDIPEDYGFNKYAFIVYEDGKEIPSQLYNDGFDCYMLFVSDFGAGDSKEFTVKYLENGKLKKEYEPRTYAELAMKFDAVYKDKKFTSDQFENFKKVVVPEIHKDHDALFKYEGPGWESEKVGYRFYLDWRNATDIFGKTVNKLILDDVGTNDVIAKDDSYHEMQDWGMDIFKVGKTLGIGSVAMKEGDDIVMVSETGEVTCEIKFNGPLLSEVVTNYKQWKVGDNRYDLVVKNSITAGSRITNTDIKVYGGSDNITTGLAKHEDTRFMESESNGEWQYMALYGKQTLNDDNLGIALFYKKSVFIEKGENENSYFIVLKPHENSIMYKYAAAWEKEPGGIKDSNEFENYLGKVLSKLDNPLKTDILKVD